MEKFQIDRFDESKRVFTGHGEIELHSLPQIGNKITLEYKGDLYVFTVYTVMFDPDGAVTIRVINAVRLDLFEQSGFPDIGGINPVT